MQAKPTNSPYQLLNKRPSPPREQLHMCLHEFINSFYPSAFGQGAFALDFEANTNKPHSTDLFIRTMALANDEYVVGVDFLGCSDTDWGWLMEWLPQQKLIVFNAMYDNALLLRKSGRLVPPQVDLYIAFKKLGGKKKSTDHKATHSLKSAQVYILDWQDKGNDEIAEYMKKHQLTWSDIRKFDQDILLRYNCLDADSTWALYQVFKELIAEHQENWGQYFGQWHREECLTAAALWIESLSHGLPIDEGQLESHRLDCQEKRDYYLTQFFDHPQIKDGVALYNATIVENLKAAEPPKHKKNGDIQVRWLKWATKVKEAAAVNHFNTNSVQQLRWLLYGYAKIAPPKGTLSTDAEALNSIGEVGQLLLNYRSMTTELKFVTQLAENNTDGKFYPRVVYPGTETGRVVSREEIR